MNITYVMVQELLQGKKESKPLSQHYVNFKTAFEELRTLFPISTYVRKMQTQWEQLDVLMFLGAYHLILPVNWPQVIGSSAVNSLSKTYSLLHNIFSEEPQHQIEG